MLNKVIVVIIILVQVLGGQSNSCRAEELILPKAGILVFAETRFQGVYLKGLRLDPNKGFSFNFKTNKKLEKIDDPSTKEHIKKLVEYFLTALTVPENNLWVNLSPYEKDDVIASELASSRLGRDLLAEDYILKQVAASLLHPDHPVGKIFWQKAYTIANNTKDPHAKLNRNFLSKVWIVPGDVKVEEREIHKPNQQSFIYAEIVRADLKVMLDSDYKAIVKNKANENSNNDLTLYRDMLLPELNKIVNESKEFDVLRQVYHSAILASWYKEKLSNTLLSKAYVDRNKMLGLEYKKPIRINAEKPNNNQNDIARIYQHYLKSYKNTPVHIVKEDLLNQVTRFYAIGGVKLTTSKAMTVEESSRNDSNDYNQIRVDLQKPSMSDYKEELAENARLASVFINRLIKRKDGLSTITPEIGNDFIYELTQCFPAQSIKEMRWPRSKHYKIFPKLSDERAGKTIGFRYRGATRIGISKLIYDEDGFLSQVELLSLNPTLESKKEYLTIYPFYNNDKSLFIDWLISEQLVYKTLQELYKRSKGKPNEIFGKDDSVLLVLNDLFSSTNLKDGKWPVYNILPDDVKKTVGKLMGFGSKGKIISISLKQMIYDQNGKLHQVVFEAHANESNKHKVKIKIIFEKRIGVTGQIDWILAHGFETLETKIKNILLSKYLNSNSNEIIVSSSISEWAQKYGFSAEPVKNVIRDLKSEGYLVQFDSFANRRINYIERLRVHVNSPSFHFDTKKDIDQNNPIVRKLALHFKVKINEVINILNKWINDKRKKRGGIDLSIISSKDRKSLSNSIPLPRIISKSDLEMYEYLQSQNFTGFDINISINSGI